MLAILEEPFDSSTSDVNLKQNIKASGVTLYTWLSYRKYSVSLCSSWLVSPEGFSLTLSFLGMALKSELSEFLYIIFKWMQVLNFSSITLDILLELHFYIFMLNYYYLLIFIQFKIKVRHRLRESKRKQKIKGQKKKSWQAKKLWTCNKIFEKYV